jgi:hypothetical protein
MMLSGAYVHKKKADHGLCVAAQDHPQRQHGLQGFIHDSAVTEGSMPEATAAPCKAALAFAITPQNHP